MRVRPICVVTAVIVLLVHGTALAHSGCCSHHGGVSGCRCADGTSLSETCTPYYPSCSAPAPVTQPTGHVTVPVASVRATSSASTSVSVGNVCRVRGALPDPTCTPGAVFNTATKAQICVSGYSTTVRDVPQSLWNKVFAEYGITVHSGATYEVDHLIPLEIGGSNDIKNLWPEAASPTPGFHDKDRLENYLHRVVCSGSMSLSEAQKEIATDWLGTFKKFFQH